MKIYQKFRPITATPSRCTDEYVEIAPCEELRPFIRCFWGSRHPILSSSARAAGGNIVIPDTCADIIFAVHNEEHSIESSFCGICDQTFFSPSLYGGERTTSVFGVRFYAWSVVLFSDENMKGSKNCYCDAGVFFEQMKREMENILYEQEQIGQRVLIAQKYLLKRLKLQRENSLFMRAISKIVEENGNRRVLELATDLHISSRQMERVFETNMGVTPKKAIDLIRYQSLWQEVYANKAFNILDAVYKYGYTDQAHLLNDFRKKHGISLKEAVTYAEDVAYLQESADILM